MAFCRNCGKMIDDNAPICPNCGMKQPNQDACCNCNSNVVDNGGVGWGILGCAIPVAGLVLYLVWKDTKPKTAKAAGIGALVSVGLFILFYIIVIAFGVGTMMYD